MVSKEPVWAVLLAYIIVIAIFIFIGGALLSFCWNLVIPVLWPGAPMLGLVQGIAFVGLLWIIRGVLKD